MFSLIFFFPFYTIIYEPHLKRRSTCIIFRFLNITMENYMHMCGSLFILRNICLVYSYFLHNMTKWIFSYAIFLKISSSLIIETKSPEIYTVWLYLPTNITLSISQLQKLGKYFDFHQLQYVFYSWEKATHVSYLHKQLLHNWR